MKAKQQREAKEQMLKNGMKKVKDMAMTGAKKVSKVVKKAPQMMKGAVGKTIRGMKKR